MRKYARTQFISTFVQNIHPQTNTHTHMRRLSRIQAGCIHAYIYARKHNCIYIYIYIYIHTYIHTYICTDTHTYMVVCMNVCTYRHSHTHIQKQTHKPDKSYISTHT